MKIVNDTMKWVHGLGEWNNFAYFIAGGAAVYVGIWLLSRPIAVVAPSAHATVRGYPTVYGAGACASCGQSGSRDVPRW